MTRLSNPNIGKVYFMPYYDLYPYLVLDIKPGFEKDINANTITVKDLISKEIITLNSRSIMAEKHCEIEDDYKPKIIKRFFEELQ